MQEVTRILQQPANDPRQAVRELFPLVYEELRQIAARQLQNEAAGNTLQTTGLVHEAFLRLVDSNQPQMENRRYFFAAAAEAMRRILIESARQKLRQKRGGEYKRADLPADSLPEEQKDVELLELDEALNTLAKNYPIHAELVQLRYFGGLSGDEAAASLNLSPSTADRHWTFARAWLKREMEKKG